MQQIVNNLYIYYHLTKMKIPETMYERVIIIT